MGFFSKPYRHLTSRIGQCLPYFPVRVRHMPYARPRVLVLGVYLANRANTATHVIKSLASSRYCNVEQAWVALNGDPPSESCRAVTAYVIHDQMPKFTLLNKLLGRTDLAHYDYLMVCDDDIRLPRQFCDAFIGWQQYMSFSLAQPARTWTSYIDHLFVRRRPWLSARQTRFVEIGPLFSLHRSLFKSMLPFDEASPMGWGYDLVWPVAVRAEGERMGIIDATPIDHSMRGRGEAYSAQREMDIMASFLADRPHLRAEEAFSVVRSVSRWS